MTCSSTKGRSLTSEHRRFRSSTRGMASLVVVLALFTSPVRAEGVEDEGPSGQPLTSAAGDAKLKEARIIVATAQRLFLAGHYGAALAEYTRAYQVLDGHPRQFWVLHNLAACNEHLFRYEIAVELYEEYLRRAPQEESDRAEVAAIVRTLRSLLVVLEVESSVPGEVWVDERRIGTAPGRWLVPTGRHLVELKAALHETERRDVDLGAARATRLHFEPRSLSTYRGPGKGYFWAAVGASGAGVVTGATFGVMALGARKDGQEQADLFQGTEEESRRTRNRALAADVGFGAALVFGVTATVLYFVTDWSSRGQQGQARSTPPVASKRRGLGRGFTVEF